MSDLHTALEAAMPDTVTIDATTAAWLVAGSLSDMWYADQDLGCCPICCGPCAAIKALLVSGQLDDVLRPYELTTGLVYWVDDRVDRDFLARTWRMTECHVDDEPELTR